MMVTISHQEKPVGPM